MADATKPQVGGACYRAAPRKRLRDTWAEWLGGFGFNYFGTVTFERPARSATLAIDRAARVLRGALGELGIPLTAFVIAAPHRGGTYHAHALLRIDPGREGIVSHLERVAHRDLGYSRFGLIRNPGAVCQYVARHFGEQADYRFVGMGRRARRRAQHRSGERQHDRD